MDAVLIQRYEGTLQLLEAPPIHILEINFMKARDEMKDVHVHVLTYAYTECMLFVEKSIRTLDDLNIKDNSS